MLTIWINSDIRWLHLRLNLTFTEVPWGTLYPPYLNLPVNYGSLRAQSWIPCPPSSLLDHLGTWAFTQNVKRANRWAGWSTSASLEIWRSKALDIWVPWCINRNHSKGRKTTFIVLRTHFNSWAVYNFYQHTLMKAVSCNTLVRF